MTVQETVCGPSTSYRRSCEESTAGCGQGLNLAFLRGQGQVHLRPRQPPPTTVRSRMQGSQGLLCSSTTELYPLRGSSVSVALSWLLAPPPATQEIAHETSRRGWSALRGAGGSADRSQPGQSQAGWRTRGPTNRTAPTCSEGGRPVHCVQVSPSCGEGRMRDSETSPPGQSGCRVSHAGLCRGCARMCRDTRSCVKTMQTSREHRGTWGQGQAGTYTDM